MYFSLGILFGICSFIFGTYSSEISYVLPTHIIPTHYQLNLTLIDTSFTGAVAINITVYERSKSIALNSYSHIGLLEQDVKLEQNGKEIDAVSIDFNSKNEMLTIQFSEEFGSGDYVLKIKYTGECTKLDGLQFASHELSNKEVEYYWATYFQPIYARRVFPCFDEPQLKATFQLQLTHMHLYDAVSNTEVEQRVSNGDSITTYFKKTPKMSTYNFAFEVSKFKSKELISNDYNKRYRLYAKLSLVNSTDFALNLTKTSVDFFERLLGIDYGLPKLDSVFIPEFPGGMENWGLIVYGNGIFKTEVETELINAIDLVCHEVAHQWFGNLVTCSSWDYTWLNEGFASHYSMKCAEAIYGNNSTRRFMTRNVIKLDTMYEVDSSESTRSVNHHAEIPQQIMSYKFDRISYVKGSVMVRFMSTFIPNFSTLITKYLKKYSYSSVSANDLFNSLNENQGLPANVKDIMNNWVETPGYPLITLNISRNNAGMVIEIEQERFLVNTTKKSNQKWWIPITLAFDSNPDFDNMNVVEWMRDTDNKITIEIKGKANDWVIANLQATVFCRVNYDLDNWNRIINYLKGPNFEKIHAINRARLLDDANYLAKVGKLPETVVLDLLGYLEQETDPLIIKSAERILKAYEHLLQKTNISADFKSYSSKILGKKSGDIDSLRQKHDSFKLVSEALESLEHRSDDEDAINELTENLYSKIDFKKLETLISKLSDQSNSDYIQRLIAMVSKRFKLNETVKNRFLNGANLKELTKWFKHL